MIISHKHKYIFVKTAKVAGTSVEIFFQQMSFEGAPQHSCAMIDNEDGIVGSRGDLFSQGLKGVEWKNHHTLPRIKKLLGNDKMFNEYFKFSVTRNPWDRVVSKLHHKKSLATYGTNPLAAGGPKPIVDYFGDFIDDVHFIRFENLQEDVEYVCEKLGLDYDMNNLGTYKSDHREHARHKHYTEYYDDETRDIVAKKYAKDIEYFGYKFRE